MRAFLTILILCCSMITHMTCAQRSEKDQITAVIAKYLEGQRTDDPELIRQVFHDEASIKFISVRDTTYQTIQLDRYLTFFKGTKKREFENKTHYIDITGTAANVKLSLKYDTYKYTHYLNMLMTSDGWKIVNKITCQENF